MIKIVQVIRHQFIVHMNIQRRKKKQKIIRSDKGNPNYFKNMPTAQTIYKTLKKNLIHFVHEGHPYSLLCHSSFIFISTRPIYITLYTRMYVVTSFTQVYLCLAMQNVCTLLYARTNTPIVYCIFLRNNLFCVYR